nr:putative ribonuclease H-like domain-containing protein [Tanacetum cinerariifolium]
MEPNNSWGSSTSNVPSSLIACRLSKSSSEVGISHETSVARSPQQNGVVERRNRTLIEAARTMLIYAQAPLFLWAEAVATPVLLKIVPLFAFDMERLLMSSAQTMATTIEQQVALDEALVPSTQRLRIGRSNFRLPSDIQSKESTLQVVYDVLRSCPFFKAFLDTADVPKIYMQEFWATAYVHQHSIRFKLDNKKHIEILEFLRFLGHSAQIRTLTDVNINKLFQPWRSFGAVINKCLTGKSSSFDSFRLSQAQILWGLYHSRNIDYAFLIWEDFVYQVEHKNHDEGTGSKPGVPDVPTDESEEELSWNSSDDEGDYAQEKVGDDDEGDEGKDSEQGEEDDDDDQDQEVAKHDHKDDIKESKEVDEEGKSDEEDDNEEKKGRGEF